MFLAIATLCMIGDPSDCTMIKYNTPFETKEICESFIEEGGAISLQMFLAQRKANVYVANMFCVNPEEESA